jgi:hypothetical protein
MGGFCGGVALETAQPRSTHYFWRGLAKICGVTLNYGDKVAGTFRVLPAVLPLLAGNRTDLVVELAAEELLLDQPFRGSSSRVPQKAKHWKAF